jgi:hypothetical protein
MRLRALRSAVAHSLTAVRRLCSCGDFDALGILRLLTDNRSTKHEIDFQIFLIKGLLAL